MIRPLVCFLIFVALTVSSFGQPGSKFTVFDGKGNLSSIDAIMASLDKTDVIFLGELHDDSIGHAVQLEIFKRAVEKYLPGRRVTLSLEMFERDVQTVVDEYLAGLISENHFMLSSRPWPNYKADYRPLVELAKEKKLDVVAANAPRRYVNMVSRNGRGSLSGLSKQAKSWLAPLPYAEASDAYAKKFRSLMGASAEASMGLDKVLSSQSLWDATMAHSVAQSLKKNKRSLVVHLNGGFHTEKRLGTVEHLLKYRPKSKIIVVTIRYENDFKKFDPAKHVDAGDFVILTEPKPKTQSVLRRIFERVDRNNSLIQSMKSDIRMSRYNAELKEYDIFDGALMYLSGNAPNERKFRVDWSRPVQETTLLDGNLFEIYRPRLTHVITGKIEESKGPGVEPLIFRLLNASSRSLRDDYEIAYFGEATLNDGVKTWWLRFSPRKSTVFKIAEAWIDVDGITRQVRITEHNGDTSTIHLKNFNKDVDLKGDQFKIAYPKATKRISA